MRSGSTQVLVSWRLLGPQAAASRDWCPRGTTARSTRQAACTPTPVGGLFGDWREEAVYPNANQDELIIFTTNQPTSTRLYTLAHNPAHHNAMTVKGYLQSHHLDYFLGAGMSTPPRPNITYAGS